MNVPGLRKNCSNLKNDYDKNGKLKKDAKLKVYQYKDETDLLANGVNKNVCFAPDDWALVKAWIAVIRKGVR